MSPDLKRRIRETQSMARNAWLFAEKAEARGDMENTMFWRGQSRQKSAIARSLMDISKEDYCG